MSIWILLAVLAQFVNALVALVDKHIVTDEKVLPRPFVYAFTTCLLSGASILVFILGWIPLPFQGIHFPHIENVRAPSLSVVAFSFLAAYTFFMALVSLFSALKAADASDVVPVVGSVSAIATFILAYLFLDARLTPNYMIGIVLLALGTLIMSHLRFSWRVGLLSVHAGIFFAFHYVTFKGLLGLTHFDNAFFWSRIGFALMALSLLLVPEYLEKIGTHAKSAGKRAGVFIIGNKILAGVGALLVLKATELGDTAVVQALGGLQFVFLFILAALFGPKTPHSFGENSTRSNDLIHKALAIAVISLGFYVLFV